MSSVFIKALDLILIVDIVLLVVTQIKRNQSCIPNDELSGIAVCLLISLA